MLLLCALMAGSGSAFGQTSTITIDFEDNQIPTGWTNTNDMAVVSNPVSNTSTTNGSYCLSTNGKASNSLTSGYIENIVSISIDATRTTNNTTNEVYIDFCPNTDFGSTDTQSQSVTVNKNSWSTSTLTLSNTASGYVRIRRSGGNSTATKYIDNIVITYSGTPTYSVSYNSNGATSGSVPTDNKAYEADDEVTVLGNSGELTKTGNAFGGWNTKADGTGNNYDEGDKFKISANTTLYAKWTPYTITVLSNNDSYGSASLSGFVITATPADGCRYASPAYTLSGDATVVQNGNEFTVTPTSNCTVTINFEPIPSHTITWSVNGNVNTESIQEGQAITFTTPTSGVPAGYVFKGWVTEANKITGTQDTPPSYTTEATCTADITYYAVMAVEQITEGAVSLTITPNTSNVPSTYGTANTFTEYTFEGKKFKVQQMYKTTEKGVSWLQWRASGNSNGTGTMYNTDKLNKIQNIVLTYNGDKDTNKNFTVKVGTSENPTTGTSITPTTNGNVYTFDCSGGNYDYFVMTNGDGAGYLSSVEINFIDQTTVTTNYCTTVTNLPVTISAAEYATFHNSDLALDFSTTGIKTYTAEDGETSVKLNEITSGQVPANTPVVFYKEGADGTAINVPVIASAEAITGTNDLRVSTGTDVANMYVLSNGTDGVGFYPWAKTTEDLAAGKVYLQAKASYDTSRQFLPFSNEAQGIDATLMNNETKNNVVFDLQGRRVAKTAKGLYIMDGRKVMVK